MLIYAAADIHGRPDRIRAIQFHTGLHRPDVLVLAGDISHRWRPARVLDPLNRLSLLVLIIRGHIHEQAGVAVVGRTVVVNCAMGRRCAGALIRYDGSSRPTCTMLRMPEPS